MLMGSTAAMPLRYWPLSASAPTLFVAGAVFAFGRAHTPDYASGLFGRYGIEANDLKAQLGSALFGLAVVQLLLALWMYALVPGAGPAPRPVRRSHRVLGAVAFLLSLPIAYHCLDAYGVQFTDARVGLHSVTGCVLYGAFTAKVLVVRSVRLPGWALPVAGGLLFAAVAVMWSTGPVWQFSNSAAPGL